MRARQAGRQTSFLTCFLCFGSLMLRSPADHAHGQAQRSIGPYELAPHVNAEIHERLRATTTSIDQALREVKSDRHADGIRRSLLPVIRSLRDVASQLAALVTRSDQHYSAAFDMAATTRVLGLEGSMPDLPEIENATGEARFAACSALPHKMTTAAVTHARAPARCTRSSGRSDVCTPARLRSGRVDATLSVQEMTARPCH